VQSDLAAFGRWCFLAGVFLMVSGDGVTTIRQPVPGEAWPWLYLVPFTVSFLLMAVAGRIDPRRPARAVASTPIAVLLASFALSALFSQDRSLSGFAFVAMCGVAGFWWCTAHLLEDRRLADDTWLAAALAIVVLAIRVVLWRLDEGLDIVPLHVKTVAWLGKLQITWVFNLFAPFLLARFISEGRPFVRLVNGTAWIAAGVANYLLFARMGSLVFALSTLLVLVLNVASWRRRLALVAAAGVAGTVLFVATGMSSTSLASTFFDRTQNKGIDMRRGVYEEAWQLFRTHPLLGIGIGTFDKIAYEVPGTKANPDFREKGWHAHNVPLHVLTEAGILGLAAWLFVWFVILRALAAAWRTGDREQRLFSGAALVAAFALHALSMTEVMVAARAIASLRMHLAIALILVAALRFSLPACPERAAASRRACPERAAASRRAAASARD
jgi:O-antigen ligase